MLFYAVLYLHFLLENDKLLKNELVFGCFIFDEIKKNEFSEGVFEFSKGDIWKRFQKFDMGLAQNIPENSLVNVLLNNHQKKMKDFGA